MSGGKLRMRPHVPWRPRMTVEEADEIVRLVPDGYHISILPQRPGMYRVHLFRDGQVPPVASKHGVSASFAHYVAQLIAEVTEAA